MVSVKTQIKSYLEGLPEVKRNDLKALHSFILKLMPACKLWFYDGKDDAGKDSMNPTIGYGEQTLRYANGKTREYFQIGLSSNSTGITIYILGEKDKIARVKTFESKLGKVKITSFCIKFKALSGVNMAVLEEALREVVK